MKAILKGLVPAAALLAATVSAQTMVTEMTFSTPATNGSSASVSMDLHPTNIASGLLVLKGDGTYLTEIREDETKIGRRWDPKLHSGFLHVGYFAHTEIRNQVGTATSDRFGYCCGVSEQSSTIPGTLYMVVQPQSEWHLQNGRRTLFGTGHAGDGYIRLWHQNKTLFYNYARKMDGTNYICQLTMAPVWDTNKWYFVAASWQAGQTPVLYRREMSAEGTNSPAATLGTMTTGGEGTTTVYESTPRLGKYGHPFLTPLGIGCHYYNPGNKAGTIDGGDVKIAWLRIDDDLSTVEQIEEVFNSLVAPEDATLITIR
ncbi:MAG: hypothetical protein ACOX9C_05595 [Kiritimatiellia bacterium]